MLRHFALFDDAVRSERTAFDIMENPADLLASEISFSDIRDAVTDKAAEYLSKSLEENKTKAKDRVDYFVSNKAPRYRPILARIPSDKLMVDPDISDKDLDLLCINNSLRWRNS